MTRWLLIGLAVCACSKGKESAPAPGAAASEPSSPPAPVTATSSPPLDPTGSDPEAERKETLEKARNEASLGVSGRTDAFDPIEQGEGGTGKAAKTMAPGHRSDVKVGAGGDVKVGGGTRSGDKANYRAVIVAVTVDGKPAPAAFSTAIKGNIAKVQSCYATALASSPDLIGKLAVTFTVLPTGALTAGAIGTSTLKQAMLESCVITALGATKLAAPLGTTAAKAEVTIQFKAK